MATEAKFTEMLIAYMPYVKKKGGKMAYNESPWIGLARRKKLISPEEESYEDIKEEHSITSEEDAREIGEEDKRKMLKKRF